MKTCKRCLRSKDKSEFIGISGKEILLCHPCNAAKLVAARKRHMTYKDTELYRTMRKNNRLSYKYGINIRRFNAMLVRQDGLCAICNSNLLLSNSKGWGGIDEACVDHNHTTGKVRGILCRKCNLSLSVVENKDFVCKANLYLLKSEKTGDKELL